LLATQQRESDPAGDDGTSETWESARFAPVRRTLPARFTMIASRKVRSETSPAIALHRAGHGEKDFMEQVFGVGRTPEQVLAQRSQRGLVLP
jgi:hypothetical protein